MAAHPDVRRADPNEPPDPKRLPPTVSTLIALDREVAATNEAHRRESQRIVARSAPRARLRPRAREQRRRSRRRSGAAATRGSPDDDPGEPAERAVEAVAA